MREVVRERMEVPKGEAGRKVRGLQETAILRGDRLGQKREVVGGSLEVVMEV